MSRPYVAKTGAELATLAASGDEEAQNEIAIRKAKREAKAAGIGPAAQQSGSAETESAEPGALKQQVQGLELQVRRLTARVVALEEQMALFLMQARQEKADAPDDDFSRA